MPIPRPGESSRVCGIECDKGQQLNFLHLHGVRALTTRWRKTAPRFGRLISGVSLTYMDVTIYIYMEK